MSKVDRTKQKVVRGGGTIIQHNFMHLIQQIAHATKTFTGSDGNVYPDTSYRQWTDDAGIKRSVKYKKHEMWGMEYLNKFLDKSQNHYEIDRKIKMLTHPDIDELLRLTHGNQPVTLATTVYHAYKDDHVKLYQHPDGPHILGNGTQSKYPAYQQWLSSWKNRLVLMPSVAKEFKKWLGENKTRLELIKAQATLNKGREDYKRVEMRLRNAKQNVANAEVSLANYEKAYDTKVAEWDAEMEWFKAAPKHIRSQVTRLDINIVSIRRKQSPQMELKFRQDALKRNQADVDNHSKMLETLKALFGGEEE